MTYCTLIMFFLPHYRGILLLQEPVLFLHFTEGFTKDFYFFLECKNTERCSWNADGTIFWEQFSEYLLYGRNAAFLLSQTQLGRKAQEEGSLVKTRYGKVCYNYFDHSPYDKTEKTYQTKSLLSTVCSYTKAWESWQTRKISTSSGWLSQTCIIIYL